MTVIIAWAPILSLIVSIIGWFYIARTQKKLLNRQIAADKEIERMKVTIPRRLGQFDKIMGWVTETRLIKRLVETIYFKPEDHANFPQRFMKWEDLFWTEINPIAEILDPELARVLRRSFILRHMSFSFILNGHREYSETQEHKTQLENAESELDLILKSFEEKLTS
jgi:hypothetical protein